MRNIRRATVASFIGVVVLTSACSRSAPPPRTGRAATYIFGCNGAGEVEYDPPNVGDTPWPLLLPRFHKEGIAMEIRDGSADDATVLRYLMPGDIINPDEVPKNGNVERWGSTVWVWFADESTGCRERHILSMG